MMNIFLFLHKTDSCRKRPKIQKCLNDAMPTLSRGVWTFCTAAFHIQFFLDNTITIHSCSEHTNIFLFHNHFEQQTTTYAQSYETSNFATTVATTYFNLLAHGNDASNNFNSNFKHFLISTNCSTKNRDWVNQIHGSDTAAHHHHHHHRRSPRPIHSQNYLRGLEFLTSVSTSPSCPTKKDQKDAPTRQLDQAALTTK